MNTKILSTRPSVAALTFVAALLPCAAFAQPVNLAASVQTVSDTPAATLLVPYFEVDLSNPSGANTVFTIKNPGSLPVGTSGAVLAHVTIWSDLGVPVFNFNVYLTGYDVETVDMRKVLTGTLPQTASAGQDPQDAISPKGSLSQDFNIASCTGQLPPAPLTGPQIADLTASLTGNPSAAQAGQCAGLNHGDNVARGYVTIDTVNNCTTRTPADSGYLGGDTTNQNYLTGEVFYLNMNQIAALGGNLVHIHANPDSVNIGTPVDPLTTTSGDYTFYGRLDGFSAVDNRQPLATNFNARYNPGGKEAQPPTTWRHTNGPGPTWLIVWRDPKVAQGYFACGTTPAWYPLGQADISAFDEQERFQSTSGLKPFPAATQKVQIGGSTLPLSWAAGWLSLNLNTAVNGAVGPTGDLGAAQAWVDVIETGFKVMHRAQQADSATTANHSLP